MRVIEVFFFFSTSQPSSVRQPKELCLELQCVQSSSPNRSMGDVFSVFVSFSAIAGPATDWQSWPCAV